MDMGITKMSTKGQIVIPADMRDDFKVGEKLIVIKQKDKLLLKKASSVSKKFLEDLEFAKRTAEALKEVDEGKFTVMEAEEFFKEIEKW
ncbi:MAG: AbrB/MazE/SpoVT family DNA-binding domain-containing protein [Candidatus Woesearchaeota archaeon]|nr:MAG: AbrB/MazE/SpoVT family DNA-binding domain-containing protein [Candidatus Woesearchaeota archaeon]